MRRLKRWQKVLIAVLLVLLLLLGLLFEHLPDGVGISRSPNRAGTAIRNQIRPAARRLSALESSLQILVTRLPLAPDNLRLQQLIQ